MRILLIVFAVLAMVIGVIGLIFKLMHWPGAHLMLLVSGVLIGISSIIIIVRLLQNKHL